jgi:hypothetical protein
MIQRPRNQGLARRQAKALDSAWMRRAGTMLIQHRFS